MSDREQTGRRGFMKTVAAGVGLQTVAAETPDQAEGTETSSDTATTDRSASESAIRALTPGAAWRRSGFLWEESEPAVSAWAGGGNSAIGRFTTVRTKAARPIMRSRPYG